MLRAENQSLWQFLRLFAAMYASFGVASPFLPSYLSSLGLTPVELGVALGGGTAVRLLSGPIAGRIADRIGSLRRVLVFSLILAAGFTLGLVFGRGYAALFMLSLLYAAALAPITQLADAMTIAASSSGHARFEYGWVRGTGSAAFILGTLIAGQAIASYHLATALWLQTGLLVVTLILTVYLPEHRPRTQDRAVRSTREEALSLLRIPSYRRLVLVATLVLGSHAMHDAFAMVRWQAAGIAPSMASVLWSEAVAGEVLVFFLVGPRLLRIVKPAVAMALAALTGVLRWTVMAQTASVSVLVLIQPLHGFTFALLHLACMRTLSRIVPAGMEGTAQAIYATVGIGSVSALLTLGSGSLYATFGSQAFLAMASLCVIALPLSYGLRETV